MLLRFLIFVKQIKNIFQLSCVQLTHLSPTIRRLKVKLLLVLVISVNVELTEKGLSSEQMSDRAVWRQLVTYIDPTWKWENDAEEEEVLIISVLFICM